MPGIWATTAAGQQKQRHSPQDNTKPHQHNTRQASPQGGVSRAREQMRGPLRQQTPAHETEQDDNGRWSLKKNAITRWMCEEKAQIKLNVW